MIDRQRALGITLRLMIWAFAPLLLTAQPTISYIIPDIGAPGMNTYVEIIAPVNRPGSFDPGSGQSGILPLSALKIELVNPLDSQRVVISPGAVSWEGRLIGCQFFVHPQASTGPVPIRVRVNGATSNVDTFFIVRPQSLPVGSNGGVLGSGGLWGTRSKRGAMIVDSLVLGNGSFTVARTDSDPGTPGNQGFLPAVIISRGPVSTAGGTRFNVDAIGKDGGPGGGGGGGYGSGPAFPPIPGERNTPLGSGYTGGKSDVPAPFNSPASSFGVGSGANSNSLNGVSSNSNFSTSPSTLRLYGAGPGHPFDGDGRSGGAAALAGTGINAFGVYYGGGGNATDGTGLPAAQNDFSGQLIGNRQIVPLHGGGGGASGGTNDSVGAGGGGGLALYSQIGAVVTTAAAQGARGADGCNGCGPGGGDASGGGAGGSIIIGGKNGVQLGTVDVRGGAAGTTAPGAPPGSTSGGGGVGRFRFDGRIARGTLTVSTGATVWTGPTIDTATVITTPLFKLRGTGRYEPGVQTDIRIYVSGEDTPWNPSIVAPYTATVRSDSTWEVDIGLTTLSDSLIYVFAVQLTSSAERLATDSATRIPSVIFSQSAANILRYYPAPNIGYTPRAIVDTILCTTRSEIIDTIIVRNTGEGPLEILRGAIRFSDATPGSFQFLRNPSENGGVTLENGEFDTIIVRVPINPAVTANEEGMVEIYSNDPDEPIAVVPITIVKRYTEWYRTDPRLIDGIDFGDVLIGSTSRRRISIINTGLIPGVNIVIDSLWTRPATVGVKILSRSIPKTVPITPGDTLTIEAVYEPTRIDTLKNSFLCARMVEPCDITLCWLMTGRGIETSITLSKPSFQIVAPPCSDGTGLFDTITIGNGGNIPFTITSAAITSGPFTLVTPTIPPNVALGPNGSQELIVRYTPGAGGVEVGVLRLTTNDPSAPEITLDILASSTPVRLDVPIDSLYLGTFCPDSQVDSTITLINSGLVADTLSFRFARGVEFSLTSRPSVIEPGANSIITVRFTPSGNGVVIDTLFIQSEPCGLRDTILLTGEVTPASYTVTPDPLDFGGLPVGSTRQISATVDNSGSGIPLVISGARIISPDGELRRVAGSFPITVPANGNASIGVEWAPSSIRPLSAGSRLEIIIDKPCPDTILVDIIGNSIKGGLTANPFPLNFGAVVNCQVVVDTVWIRNHGTQSVDSVRIREFWVDPTTAEITVAALDPLDPTPTILAGDSIGILVTFAPVTGPDGPRATTLFVRTNSPSPTFDTLEVPVTGVRFSESLSITGPAFGQTFPGGVDRQTYTITNDGTAPIAINRLVMPPPYRRVSVRPPLPAVLVAGASIEVDIEFAPSDTGTYNGSITVDGIISCDSIFLRLTARSIAPEIVQARWLNVSGEPGDIVLIPLELQTDVTGLNITALTIDLAYNPSMLMPSGVEFTAPISQSWSVGTVNREVGRYTFTASGDALQGAGSILFVRATILLGDEITTPLASSSDARFTSGAGRLAVDTGEFQLEGYCMIGSDRLIRLSGDFGIKLVTPHPVTDRVRIDFETVEDGPTRLEIFDMLGRKVATLTDAYLPGQAYQVELPEKPASGSYIVLLTTRTDRDMKVIVVQ